MSNKRKLSQMDRSETETKKSRLNSRSCDLQDSSVDENEGTASEGGMLSASSESSSFESQEEPEEYEYTGQKDADGLYTGEGTLLMKRAGTKYVGKFVKGVMEGNGTLFFPDGSHLSGNFRDDALNGQGCFTSTEGTKMEGIFEDNLISGPGKEFYPDGKLFFEGIYDDGLREGKGVMYYTDEEAKIEGTWVNGVLEGEAVYTYPDGSTLQGIWRQGVMKSASFTSTVDSSFDQKDQVYCNDESTFKRIAKFPLRRDPFEMQYCYAKKSEILPEAGEGLFASRDLPAGFIVALYNGIRISLKNGEKKPWDMKPNLICLNDGTCVDVPPSQSALQVFQNTIGHKANHHYNNNAKYDLYWGHPIFGKIRCIRTLKPIKKDEEIFVDYGYEEGTGPQWYIDFMQGHYPPKPQAA